VKVPAGIQPTMEPRSQAADVRLGDREQRLRQVAREFESLLMNTLLRSMRETVPKSDLIDNDGEISYYNQMHDDALAQQTAGGPSGLGIADMIVRRYLPYLEEENEGGGAPAAPQVLPEKGLAAYRRVAMQPLVEQALTVHDPKSQLRERAADIGGSVADSLSRFETEIHEASAETGVEPELLLAVMAQESAGRPDAVSGKGARGLMQLMPATAREVGVENIDDPGQNIRGGARYLSRLRDRFGDRLDLVLAGYNAGPGSVSRAGDRVPQYPETENYVSRVSTLYDRLDGREFAHGSETINR